MRSTISRDTTGLFISGELWDFAGLTRELPDLVEEFLGQVRVLPDRVRGHIAPVRELSTKSGFTVLFDLAPSSPGSSGSANTKQPKAKQPNTNNQTPHTNSHKPRVSTQQEDKHQITQSKHQTLTLKSQTPATKTPNTESQTPTNNQKPTTSSHNRRAPNTLYSEFNKPNPSPHTKHHKSKTDLRQQS